MQGLDSFLEHHVARAITGLTPPIDPYEVARQCKVVGIEEREMIPEAVLVPERDGFRIHVQTNFRDLPGIRLRQRFSIAHEIAHTFFFEQREGTLKPRRDAPIGEHLEAACHRGAGLLLVPTVPLKQAVKAFGYIPDTTSTVSLAKRFDVSIEVMLRRLCDVDAFGTSLLLVLTRQREAGRFIIEFSAYPPWLKALLPTPRRGMAFDSWFGKAATPHSDTHSDIETPGDAVVKKTQEGSLTAKPIDVTSTLRIFEVRMQHEVAVERDKSEPR